MVAAFSRLATFVQETGIDRAGLGHWSCIRVGTGDHSTRIISAYQPCNSTKGEDQHTQHIRENEEELNSLGTACPLPPEERYFP